MGQWMKSEVPFGQMAETPVQDAFADLALMDAARGSIDPHLALFSRNNDYQTTVLLLPPEAAKFVPYLPGTWVVSEDHYEHRWGTLYFNLAAKDHFSRLLEP